MTEYPDLNQIPEECSHGSCSGYSTGDEEDQPPMSNLRLAAEFLVCAIWIAATCYDILGPMLTSAVPLVEAHQNTEFSAHYSYRNFGHVSAGMDLSEVVDLVGPPLRELHGISACLRVGHQLSSQLHRYGLAERIYYGWVGVDQEWNVKAIVVTAGGPDEDPERYGWDENRIFYGWTGEGTFKKGKNLTRLEYSRPISLSDCYHLRQIWFDDKETVIGIVQSVAHP